MKLLHNSKTAQKFHLDKKYQNQKRKSRQKPQTLTLMNFLPPNLPKKGYAVVKFQNSHKNWSTIIDETEEIDLGDLEFRVSMGLGFRVSMAVKNHANQ
jgi:hypothetical protein